MAQRHATVCLFKKPSLTFLTALLGGSQLFGVGIAVANHSLGVRPGGGFADGHNRRNRFRPLLVVHRFFVQSLLALIW
jgi:hypothetical protein